MNRFFAGYMGERRINVVQPCFLTAHALDMAELSPYSWHSQSQCSDERVSDEEIEATPEPVFCESGESRFEGDKSEEREELCTARARPSLKDQIEIIQRELQNLQQQSARLEDEVEEKRRCEERAARMRSKRR